MYLLGRTQMIPAASYEDHLVPYEGDMDLTAYLQKLISVGFDGTASLDVYQYDYEAVAEKSVEYLKQILCQSAI